MKIIFRSLPALLILVAVLSACTGGRKGSGDVPESVAASQPPAPVAIGKETILLLEDLGANGDYVNSQQYPSLIKSPLVNEDSEGKNLIIDLRPPDKYSEGHIKGAVSKKVEELPGYFETGIKPFEYDKIILVCGDGQLASYTTSLLRLRGYGNVFAMRWGMSSWNRKNADEGWFKGVSGKFESMLDTTTTAKPLPLGMPDLATGLATGKEIADARFAKVFAEGAGKVFITADEVFSNPGKYFIINLERKDKYEDGHIPGAVRYKPESTLSFPQEMATIPVDKTVVIYCGTGHNSAFATAYLRLLGYDARTLRYGNNSFMYDRMVSKKAALSWLPFSPADVNDFPVVK